MPDRPRSRRVALLTSAALAAGGLSVASAAAMATTSTTPATSTMTTAIGDATPPHPHLAVNWDVLKQRCHTVTTRKRITVRHHTKLERTRVHRCTSQPVKTHSTHVHLGWRRHGVAFGRLTLAGQPIANATVTETSKIAHGKTTTRTTTTNAHGRFHAALSGPDKTVTFSYTPTPGAVFAKTGHITQRAYLAFSVGHLTARRPGYFSGIVFGGHIPVNLYVQFYYLAAHSGWQPFAGLAPVARHGGHWHAYIEIPAATRGYRYKIRAMVVRSRYWPYTTTRSRIITRIVS